MKHRIKIRLCLRKASNKKIEVFGQTICLGNINFDGEIFQNKYFLTRNVSHIIYTLDNHRGFDNLI